MYLLPELFHVDVIILILSKINYFSHTFIIKNTFLFVLTDNIATRRDNQQCDSRQSVIRE